MKLWKRNSVVAAIALFICLAVYLNWSYEQDNSEEVGKILGQSELVAGTVDPLLEEGVEGDTLTTEETPQTIGGYFDSARLNREQSRDSALTLLQDAMEGEAVETMMMETYAQSIQTLASYTVTEAQIENLITAKGYADCITFIGDQSISVVVAATEIGLQDEDVAKITEIVTGETGYTASQIKIIEAEQ